MPLSKGLRPKSSEKRWKGIDAAIRDELGAVRDESTSVFGRVVPLLGELLEARTSVAVGWDRTVSGLRTNVFGCAGVSREALRTTFDTVVQRHPTGWAAYDISRAEPAQRDRAFGLYDYLGRERLESLPIYREACRPLGLTGDQARLLVCDGCSVVAWVGVFRQERFTASEVGRLKGLARALKRRALAERLLQGVSWASSALEAALENVPAAAFVLGPKKVVLYANTAGRRALDDRGERGTRLRAALADDGPNGAFTRTRLTGPGLADHELAIERVVADRRAVIDQAARRYSLTPRQIDVLALLAAGRANKSIAAELAVSEATIELHVTAILRKAGRASRAELIAALGELR